MAAAVLDDQVVNDRNHVAFEDVERLVGNRCAAVEEFWRLRMSKNTLYHAYSFNSFLPARGKLTET